MQTTDDGKIILQKETWEIIKNDRLYKKLAERIEDLEDHFKAVSQGNTVSLNEYLKKKDSSFNV